MESLSHGNLPSTGSSLPQSHGRLPSSTGSSLPIEIWFIIFSHADPFDICCIRQVCKVWRELSAKYPDWSNIKHPYGVPLHMAEVAAHVDRLDIIKILPNGVCEWYWLIRIAASRGHSDFVQYCESKIGTSIDPVNWASAAGIAGRNNCIRGIKYCQSKGAHVNSALIGAAQEGHIGIMQYCESQGATDWETSLLAGLCSKNMDVINYCESKGACDWVGCLHYMIDHCPLSSMIQYCEQKIAEE